MPRPLARLPELLLCLFPLFVFFFSSSSLCSLVLFCGGGGNLPEVLRFRSGDFGSRSGASMVKSVGLRTARSSSCRLHALAPRSLSGEFCFVGSFLGLTASDSSGCSGSSSLLLSVACGWVRRHALQGSRASDPGSQVSLFCFGVL